MTESSDLPAEIEVDENPNSKDLLERARERLRISPQIMEGAKEFGQDIGAVATSRGGMILIGVGLLATFATIGAIVLHKAHKKES